MKPDLYGLKVGNHRLPCPKCDRGLKDRALSVEVRGDGSVWWCWRCHMSGGIRGSRVLTAYTSPDPRIVQRQQSTLAACKAIWKQTQPLAGTPGEKYLRLRCCVVPPDDGDLRFHGALFCPEVDAQLPALVARVSTVMRNKTIGIHRVWFRAGETKAVKKMRLGACDEPVCIRLWPDAAVTLGLGIAEGIETGLAAAQAFTPIWSTIDAGQMAKFPLLAGIEALTVFADYDEVGLAAATCVRDRYAKAGRSAKIWRSKRAGEDFNDMLMRQVQG